MHVGQEDFKIVMNVVFEFQTSSLTLSRHLANYPWMHGHWEIILVRRSHKEPYPTSDFLFGVLNILQ